MSRKHMGFNEIHASKEISAQQAVAGLGDLLAEAIARAEAAEAENARLRAERDEAWMTADGYDRDCTDMRYQRDAAEARATEATRAANSGCPSIDAMIAEHKALFTRWEKLALAATRSRT